MLIPYEPRIRPVLNFRELGGIPVRDGRTVKHGVLLRSGGLHLFTPEETEVLKEYGIAKILDLRGWYSWKKKPDPKGIAPHVPYDGKTSSGGDAIDFSANGFSLTGERANAKLAQLLEYYCRMPFGYQAFHAMRDVLEQGSAPFLFHCTKGKDRTGIAAMVILYLLGAEEEDILKDYLLSNDYRAEVIAERMEEARNTHPEDEGYLHLMFQREGVEEAVGRAVLAGIRSRCGSPEAYAQSEYGWDRAKLEAVRSMWLE